MQCAQRMQCVLFMAVCYVPTLGVATPEWRTPISAWSSFQLRYTLPHEDVLFVVLFVVPFLVPFVVPFVVSLLCRCCVQHPGFDFSGATFTGEAPNPRTFMGGGPSTS